MLSVCIYFQSSMNNNINDLDITQWPQMILLPISPHSVNSILMTDNLPSVFDISIPSRNSNIPPSSLPVIVLVIPGVIGTCICTYFWWYDGINNHSCAINLSFWTVSDMVLQQWQLIVQMSKAKKVCWGCLVHSIRGKEEGRAFFGLGGFHCPFYVAVMHLNVSSMTIHNTLKLMQWRNFTPSFFIATS